RSSGGRGRAGRVKSRDFGPELAILPPSPIRLGINVDHVATVRQARGTGYPDPVEAGLLVVASGADSVTVHLREDRRHIQERDVTELIKRCSAPINLEMAVTEEMVARA